MLCDSYMGCKNVHDKEYLLTALDLVVANRLDEDILSKDMEIYSKDIFYYN